MFLSESSAWIGGLLGALVLAVVLGSLPVWLLCRKPRIRYYPRTGNVSEEKAYARNEIVTLPVLSGRTCHVFEGWYFDPAFTHRAPEQIGLKRHGVVKVYARWLKKTPSDALALTPQDNRSENETATAQPFLFDSDNLKSDGGLNGL